MLCLVTRCFEAQKRFFQVVKMTEDNQRNQFQIHFNNTQKVVKARADDVHCVSAAVKWSHYSVAAPLCSHEFRRMLESYSSSRHGLMQWIQTHLQWSCSLFAECRNYVKNVSATMLWYLIESLILSNVSSQFIYIIIWSNVPNAALLDEKQRTRKLPCARNWETIYWNRPAFRWV